MKKKMLLCLVIMIVFILSSPAHAASPISSSKLISDAKKYDGKSVTFQGEAIGDVMKRGAYGWVNVHDGEGAIGIWAPMSELSKVKFLGDYNFRGDIIQVKGIYNQACEEHAGDIDIHARSITVIEAGKQVNHPVDQDRAILAAILALAAIALFIAEKRLKGRQIRMDRV